MIAGEPYFLLVGGALALAGWHLHPLLGVCAAVMAVCGYLESL